MRWCSTNRFATPARGEWRLWKFAWPSYNRRRKEKKFYCRIRWWLRKRISFEFLVSSVVSRKFVLRSECGTVRHSRGGGNLVYVGFSGFRLALAIASL